MFFRRNLLNDKISKILNSVKANHSIINDIRNHILNNLKVIKYQYDFAKFYVSSISGNVGELKFHLSRRKDFNGICYTIKININKAVVESDNCVYYLANSLNTPEHIADDIIYNYIMSTSTNFIWEES